MLVPEGRHTGDGHTKCVCRLCANSAKLGQELVTDPDEPEDART